MEEGQYHMISNYLISGALPRVYPSTKSNFISVAKKFSLDEKNRLIRDGRIVLKKEDLERVYKELHQHSGRSKTYAKFRKRFWFKGMSLWVREKVRNCVPCSNKNNLQWPAHRSPLTPIEVEAKLWWRVHVDLIGPLPRTDNGNKYIAIGVCSLSKYTEGRRNLFYFKI